MSTLVKSNVFSIVFGAGFARAYVLLVELILVIVTAQLMPPSQRGVYVAAIGLLKTISILSTFSLGQISVHRIANSLDRTAQIGIEFGNLVIAAVLFSIAGFGIFYGVSQINYGIHEKYFSPFSVVIFVGLPIYLFEVYLYTLLASCGLLRRANRQIVIGKSATWILVVFSGYVVGNITAINVITFVILGQFLVLVGYVRSILHHISTYKIRVEFSRLELLNAIKAAGWLYPTIIGSVVFGGVDLLLIYQYADAAAVSTYQIAMQGLAALSVLPFAIAQFGYAAVGEHGASVGWYKYRRVVYFGLATHILFVAISLPVAGLVNDSFFGGKYPELLGIYWILAVGSPGVFLSLSMAPLWIAHGLFRMSSVLSVGTALCMIPLTVLLLQYYGVKGGAIAFLAGQVLSVITNGLMINYCEKK